MYIVTDTIILALFGLPLIAAAASYDAVGRLILALDNLSWRERP